jgi:hypothetical protein
LSNTAKKKPYLRTLILGAASLASYIVLFTHVDKVMEYFIKGGPYAALPIITALYFSFLHGAFASGVLSVVGMKAAKGSGH